MTQGLRRSPRSTAFFASSPAPSMTCGFDVFVQLVIAAMTTAPWSSSNVSPSSSTSTLVRAWVAVATAGCGSGLGSGSCAPGSCATVGSLAGNVSATALSSAPFP